MSKICFLIVCDYVLPFVKLLSIFFFSFLFFSFPSGVLPNTFLWYIDEDDEYRVLRRAVKEYRATMKEYYKAVSHLFQGVIN